MSVLFLVRAFSAGSASLTILIVLLAVMWCTFWRGHRLARHLDSTFTTFLVSLGIDLPGLLVQMAEELGQSRPLDIWNALLVVGCLLTLTSAVWSVWSRASDPAPSP